MIPATDEFISACAEFGIELESGEAEGLHAYLEVLYEANQTTNLTAIRDESDAWMKHIFDALTLMPVMAELEPGEGEQIRVCDVGSGGGVPAIPLAIVRPDVSFTMLEATGRKTELLKQFAEKLGLKNISVVNGRAEQLGAFETGEMRDRFDLVTARALGRITVASELCVPLAREGGIIALIKGQKADEELAEAKKALHMLCVSHTGTIDTPTGRIVVIEKARATPKLYPRRDGEPKRAPLL
jgi:16S rRNA (guanine527-N7)-methyltransferase